MSAGGSVRDHLTRMSSKIFEEGDGRAAGILQRNSRAAFRRKRWFIQHEIAAATWIAGMVFEEERPCPIA